MSHRTKFKIQRALGLELPGLGKPGALATRAFPPGQHGQARRSKLSEYGLQLREKQKVLFHYGLREEQLRRFVRDARRISPSNWINALVTLLERRLDNLVFRLGFARSIAAARQLVSHGHILVNGRPLTIGSAVVKLGAHITLTDYAAGEMTFASRTSPRLPLPEFLEFQTIENGQPLNTHGILRSYPRRASHPFRVRTAARRRVLRAERHLAMPTLNPIRPAHETTDSGTKKLASAEGLGDVTMCGCGTLSLNIQAMSLRLDMKAFAQLLILCSEAMDALETIARRTANDENLQPVCPLPSSTLIH